MSSFKGYANTYIYSKKNENGINAEYELIEYIKMSERINKESEAFAYIKNMVKSRQTTAILYRILMSNDIVLCMNLKELPASFKVFFAKDIRTDGKKRKVFIDCTGLLKLNNGYYECKEIDKLCAYLINALNTMLYFESHDRLVNNTIITKTATNCFIKLFNGVIDNMRISNFRENKNKIAFIVGTYFLYNVIQKDIRTAISISASVTGISNKEATAYSMYFTEEDLTNISSFIKFLAETFKFKGLTVDTYVNKWIYLYGPGTMYGIELYPNFLSIITNAYSGSYINNQRMIENLCGKELVALTTAILRAGSDEFDSGFRYEAAYEREAYSENKKK